MTGCPELRRRVAFTTLGLITVLMTPAFALAEEALPLTRLRLYDSGIAYYERSGSCDGRGEIAVPVSEAQLDDVLKTLVVMAPESNLVVTNLKYSTRTTRELALRLAGTRENEDGRAPALEDLLAGLWGARVEVRTAGRVLAGRLVEVSRAPCRDDSEEAKSCPGPGDVTVLTERGELGSAAWPEVLALRVTDEDARVRFGSALDALQGSTARRAGSLRLAGAPGARVTLGYVTEAPLWRASYRLVLGGDEALMQGWAHVHNDTSEDWKALQVELANGEPDSLVSPVAAPRYLHRQVKLLADGSRSVPQLVDSVDALHDGDAWSVGGMGLSGIGEGGGGYGQGVRMGGAMLGRNASSSTLLQVGNLAHAETAEGVEQGALFTFKLAKPLDLTARTSAVVPLVHAKVTVRRISWLDRPGATARAGVHLTNTTDSTLPAGSLGVFADGGFVGEARIERLKPAESHVVEFGRDLDVELGVKEGHEAEEPGLFELGEENLVEHYVRRRRLRYRLINRGSSARTVYVGLDVVDNARVSGEGRGGFDRARRRAWVALEVGPRQEQSPEVVLEEGLQRTRKLDALTVAQLRAWARAPSVPAVQRATLASAAKVLVRMHALERSVDGLVVRVDQLQGDREQLRRDLEVLGSRASKSGTLTSRLLTVGETHQRVRAEAQRARKQLMETRRDFRETLAGLASQGG